MPEPKRPLKVFLCHAHADRDPVRGLYARLTQDGVDAWLDKAKLLPGQDWELEIRKAVRDADVVVVCLSKQFNQAGFRQKEVRLALDTAMEKPEGEIFIIPARLEECDNLESLRKWHWVDLFEEDGYEMLLRALRTRANKIDATLQINSVVRENKQREAAEKVERERVAQEAREKREREAAEKATKEKTEKDFQREVDNRFKKVKRELQLESYRTKIHHWLARVRIYALPNTLFLIGIIFAISMAFYYSKNIPILNQILNAAPQPTPENTQTQAIDTPQNTIEPSMTAALQSTSTSANTLAYTPLPTDAFTPTPELGNGSTIISEKDGMTMVYVPGGEFTMGTDNGYSHEGPAHDVFLDAFWIDKTEITNGQYANCVRDEKCSAPFYSGGIRDYIFDEKLADYPVVKISWESANAYCQWVGRRLPTEAEWEKAARGIDGRIYPWGDESPTCKLANISGCITKDFYSFFNLAPVASYPSGVSPYGAFDMIGNVWEWVADKFDETYYVSSPSANPLGPATGQLRVIRGGSAYHTAKVFSRAGQNEELTYVYSYSSFLGFRCTKDVPP